MTRAVIYSRFSPRPGASACESIETQLAICRRYCADRGYEIIGEYADPETTGGDAGKLDAADEMETRPGLKDALSKLSRGCVLVVYKRDRLIRSVFVTEYVRRKLGRVGARLESVDGMNGDSPQIVMGQQVMASADELARKLGAERTSQAMLEHQRRGRRMSARTPYGWERDEDREREAREEYARTGIERPMAFLKENADEQRILTRMQQLRDQGYGYRRIANTLTGEGVTARCGTEFGFKTVERILRRESGTEAIKP